jgi:hypothetical protein
MSEEELMVVSRKYFKHDRIDATLAEENGKRNNSIETVLSDVVNSIDQVAILDKSVDLVMQQKVSAVWKQCFRST